MTESENKKRGWGWNAALVVFALLLLAEFGLPGVITGIYFRLHGWPYSIPQQRQTLDAVFYPARELCKRSKAYDAFCEREFQLTAGDYQGLAPD